MYNGSTDYWWDRLFLLVEKFTCSPERFRYWYIHHIQYKHCYFIVSGKKNIVGIRPSFLVVIVLKVIVHYTLFHSCVVTLLFTSTSSMTLISRSLSVFFLLLLLLLFHFFFQNCAHSHTTLLLLKFYSLVSWGCVYFIQNIMIFLSFFLMLIHCCSNLWHIYV